MSSALRYVPHYTVADYQAWEGDWELWNGIAVSMSPAPFGRHQALAAKLIASLDHQIEAQSCDATVMGEMDWVVNDSTVVRPDVVVVCGGVPARHVVSPPALIVEIISRDSVERDTIHKRDLYEQEGVANYVVIDLPNETAWMHRHANQWQLETVAPKCELNLCDDCSFELDLAKFFDATRPR